MSDLTRAPYKHCAELLKQIDAEVGPPQCWAYSYEHRDTRFHQDWRLSHGVCIGHPASFFIINADLGTEELRFVSATKITVEEFKSLFDELHGQVMPNKPNWE